MKKTICIILAIICAFSLFARDNHVTSTESGRLAEDLLEDGLYKNQEQLLTVVPVLTPAEITLLYNKNKANAIKDTMMNSLLGFGIGSFNAGDRKGGWIQLGCELGGTAITITSLGYLLAYGAVGFVNVLFGKTDMESDTMVKASALGLLLGTGVFFSGRIYGIIRGIKYPKQYNKDLQETLYGTAQSGPAISLTPIITPQNIGFGVGVRF